MDNNVLAAIATIKRSDQADEILRLGYGIESIYRVIVIPNPNDYCDYDWFNHVGIAPSLAVAVKAAKQYFCRDFRERSDKESEESSRVVDLSIKFHNKVDEKLLCYWDVNLQAARRSHDSNYCICIHKEPLLT